MELVGEADRDEQRSAESDTPKLETQDSLHGRAAMRPYAARRYDLPAVPETADLARSNARPLWLALSITLCFALTLLVYLAWLPRFLLFSNPPTGDQPYYLMDVISLVQDGDLELTNNYDNSDFDQFYSFQPPDFIGISSPYPLPPMLANAYGRPLEEKYPFHLPGLSLLLIPAWVIGSQIDMYGTTAAWPATVVFMFIIGALVCANIWLLAHEITGRIWIAWAVWLPVAFSGPVMSFSYLLFTELPTGLLLVYVFRRLALGWGANGPLRRLLIGLSIAYMPWLAWRCVPIALALCVYAFVQWRRYRVVGAHGRAPLQRVASKDTAADAGASIAAEGEVEKQVEGGTQLAEGTTAKASPDGFLDRLGGAVAGFFRALWLFVRSPKETWWVVIPVAVSAVGLIWYNIWLFGSAIPNSNVLEQGRVAIFYWPWAGLDELAKFMLAAFGLLLDQQFGLFPYSPIYVLAIVGMIAMFRLRPGPDRRLLLWMALVSLPYLGIISSFYAWHGVWCPPGRYLVTFVPLIAAPLAMSLFSLTRNLATGAIYTLLYVALSIPGFVTTAGMLYDARQLWPLDPTPVYTWLVLDQSSPFNENSPYHIDPRDWGYMAWFSRPDDFKHPVDSARVIGIVLLIVFFCYLLMFFQRNLRSKMGFSLARQGTVWLGALSMLGAGWLAMNYDFLRHKTLLVHQQEWEITPALIEPYGIAYLDGKLYVTSFARDSPSGTVGELDVNTGAYNLIQPSTTAGQIEFVHPSDVKVGADGLLYVLNNGENKNALYAMKPDGRIMRQWAFTEKSPICTGLAVGPDGSFYIADMLGGAIGKYSRDEGAPLLQFRSDKGNFNNPAGVVVTEDGTVYVTENGFGQLHELAPDGTHIRKYDLKCQPIHAVIRGDWLDATCQKGLVSLNLKNKAVQLSRFQPVDKLPESATGLVYGSDDTLYVVNGSKVIQYKIQH